MKDKILEKIDDMVNIIKTSDEYQKYTEISNKMQKNQAIMTLIDEVKKLQKELVKKSYYGQDGSQIEKRIDEKIHLLEEYPIYLEYTYVLEDLNSSIDLIKNSVEKYIDHITN